MLKKYDHLIDETLEYIFVMLESEDKKLNNIIKSYFLVGGKRIRVILSLICAQLGNFDKNKEDILRLAAIVETIHTASLIHDDIIDKAKTRRGQATLNNIYDNYTALYIGDYLFACVLKEVAKFKDIRLHNYLAKTLKELCIGELIQFDGLYNLQTRRLDYLKKIKRKTAILIAFSCVGGAIVSQASDENIEKSYKYGYYLGMSYQIIDDYLDFASETTNLGKEVGQDIMNGNITLPALIAKEKSNNLFKNYNNASTKEQKSDIIKFIKENKEILQETLGVSQKYLRKAQKEIANVDEKVKEQLTFIMLQLAGRNK